MEPRTHLPADDDLWSRAASLVFENEAAVETRLIIPLLRALGYDESEDIVPKYPVVFQEGRRGRKPEADFVVFGERPHSRATSLVTVEAKHPNEDITGGKEQGESYAANVRSPILLISNGIRMQLWQYQPTYESGLIMDCLVVDLADRRGEIEDLLSKEAVIAYAAAMRHKSFGLLARDLGAYERAEFERRHAADHAISRRLKDTGPGSTETRSTDLLAKHPEGVVILAASGYGKTTLAQELRRQALERRWSGEDSRLAVEVFLPDMLSSGKEIEAFLWARVAAHCPAVSLSAFRDRLRKEGIVLLGDGFDRIPAEYRSNVEGVLATFRRDFPNAQIFLLTRPVSRPERLELPCLELLEFNEDEQRDLVERFSLAQGHTGLSFWYHAPYVLRTLCRHPLILQLTITLYKEQGHLPNRIEYLFQTWIDRLLPRSIPLAFRTDLRRLLILFSNATVSGPITEVAAVELVRNEGFSDDLLQSLLEADALVQRGAMVEVQHEALADYLRALDTVGLGSAEALQRLQVLPLREGSQLPPLLMAMASSAEMQRLVWGEIVSADITAAMSALRYRADIAPSPNASNAQEVSRVYLSDVLEGIDLPLQIYFSNLASRIRNDLLGSEVERLGIVGNVQANGGHLDYSFVNRSKGEELITVGHSAGPGRYYGKNLRAMGLRLDSGRLVGMSHIRESLLELVEERRLDGGIVWAEEKTLGRLRHLMREYNFPFAPGMFFEEAKNILMEFAGQWVVPDTLRASQHFAIDDLIADIDFLIAHGRTHFSPWWEGADALDLTTLEGQTRLSELLNLHHGRSQLAYKEVVESSFPMLAHRLPFYQVMPVRYEIEIEFHNRRGYASETLQWRWLPVAAMDDAGASVTFPVELSEIWSKASSDAYNARIDAALAQCGRSAPNRQYTFGQKGIPNFLNDFPSHDGQIDETSVLRAAAARIQDDLKYLFRELPKSDR